MKIASTPANMLQLPSPQGLFSKPLQEGLELRAAANVQQLARTAIGCDLVADT